MDGKLQILGNHLVTISVWISLLLFDRKKNLRLRGIKLALGLRGKKVSESSGLFRTLNISKVIRQKK